MHDNEDDYAEIEQLIAAGKVTDCESHLSPSGRYRLTVNSIETAPERWNFTLGIVETVAEAALVARIPRNFDGFFFSWLEAHDAEWLVAGRSYTSQTIINLDTARIFEPDGDHFDSAAFCWARAWVSPDGRTLAVEGCHWACPWEYRFFDFSTPEKGWPELPVEGGEMIDSSDGPEPCWEESSLVKCFENTGREAVAWTKLARNEDTMRIVERWASESESERRALESQREAERALRRRAFEGSDQRLSGIRGEILDGPLVGFGELSVGTTGTGELVCWAHFRRQTPKAAADFSWKPDQGLVEVTLYDSVGAVGRRVATSDSLDDIRASLDLIAQAFARNAGS